MDEPSAGAGAAAPRRPSMADALLPIGTLILLLALSYYLFRDEASYGPNQIALVFCSLVAAGLAARNGMPWSGIRQAAVDGVASGLAAIGILLAVGALIGTWSLGGTIVTMVYYGLKILSPHYFYATTMIICAVVAISIGSSWTVAGTLGVGLLGIADSMGLSPAITAGAVISGAYFGDKTSPLSDTVNLAAASAGSEVFAHIRESLWTSLPAFLAAAGLFALLGSPSNFDAAAALAGIENHVDVTPWALLPLVLVLGLAVARVPPMAAIFLGALAGGVMAAILTPDWVLGLAAAPEMPKALALLKGVWSALATGFTAATGDATLDELLSRGGMASMMVTVWLIVTALMFGAIIEHAGFLDRIVASALAGMRSTAALIASLVATCIGANIVTSDQYMAIVLPGRIYKAEFARRGLAPVLLSRSVGDSATVTSPLIPWNSCGAFMATTLGVPVPAYVAYCFFNLLNPVVSVLYAILGLRVLRVPAQDPARS